MLFQKSGLEVLLVLHFQLAGFKKKTELSLYSHKSVNRITQLYYSKAAFPPQMSQLKLLLYLETFKLQEGESSTSAHSALGSLGSKSLKHQSVSVILLNLLDVENP